MGDFCDELKKLDAECDLCVNFETNTGGACHINGKRKVFGIPDVIIINSDKGRITVETDIVQSYFTASYDDRDVFFREQEQKRDRLTAIVRPLVPEGATLLRHHVHHNPNLAPQRVGLHLHIFYRAKNLADAKRMAYEIDKAINPDAIDQQLRE